VGVLGDMTARIDMRKALPWPQAATPGDTVWLGAADADGRVVSFIQSIYWEFGSGVVLPESGIVWQNRGASFSLDPGATNALAPGRRPFHTIQPALAVLADGRVMAYGSMGGDGQPQTQAAVFTRYTVHNQPLQRAIAAPRWLLGRTWGTETASLRIESRFPAEIVETLRQRGHDIETTEPYDEIMGHAGAVVKRPDGFLEGAADPRGDGMAACF
jgi:gamma-glutamyltranspeptidase/glutathione hydrolase